MRTEPLQHPLISHPGQCHMEMLQWHVTHHPTQGAVAVDGVVPIPLAAVLVVVTPPHPHRAE